MTDITSRIQEIASSIEGTLGVAAKHLPSGQEVSFNADLVFPIASVFKVPLLLEIYRQAEAGLLDLSQRIELRPEHRVAGSGVLQDLDPGLNPTLRDLAVLMIVVSDNMATDILLEMVGRDNLARTLAKLGLKHTRVNFSTRELLFHMVGMDPSRPGGYEENRERLRQWQVIKDNLAVSDESNVSTPREMCRLLEMIVLGEILSPPSNAAVIDIMKRQKFKEILPQRLPPGIEVANKTGRLNGVRNDAGIVFAPRGPYVAALFSRSLADEAEGARALADISLAIYQHFEAIT